MNLNDYLDNAKGSGVLATADSSGKVNAAVYARHHFFDETTVAFIMRERLTHENLKTNPHATYLFIESKPGYSGKRLYLTKLREESDEELVRSICRRCDYTMFTDKLTRHVVFFTIDKVFVDRQRRLIRTHLAARAATKIRSNRIGSVRHLWRANGLPRTPPIKLP